jgi:hypothetical protein
MDVGKSEGHTEGFKLTHSAHSSQDGGSLVRQPLSRSWRADLSPKDPARLAALLVCRDRQPRGLGGQRMAPMT